MKVINETTWKTLQVKRILSKCAAKIRKLEGDSWNLRNLKVTLVYVRDLEDASVGGCAWYNSNLMRIRMPHVRAQYFAFEVAKTFIHEFGHNIGVHHTRGRTMEQYYMEWLKKEFSDEKYPIEMKPLVKKPKPTDQDKLARVQQHIKELSTRSKRIQTLLKKWKRKEKYYQKKLAQEKREEAKAVQRSVGK